MLKEKTVTLLWQWAVVWIVVILSLSMGSAQVTLSVGNGSGLPGSQERPVLVSLDNQGDEVKGVQLEICDGDNYLTPSASGACETTERTTGFLCSASEQEDGCCKIVLVSLSGGLIEKGTGPIFSLKYDVSEGAPEGESRELAPEDINIADKYGTKLSPVASESGRFYFSASIPSTTTTTVFTPTTIPVSTTTTVITSCQVSIAPLAATIKSGATLQFSAKTKCGGEEVDGSYSWQLVSASAIGSSIDQSGLFIAGDNTTDSDVSEVVEVIDTAHQNKSATATVTVKEKEGPITECTLGINPVAATISPGDTVTLSAVLTGDCDTPRYEWSLESDTNSSIDAEGDTCSYLAGENGGTEPLTDTVTVNDSINQGTAEAEISILPQVVSTTTTSAPPLCPFLQVYGEGSAEVQMLRSVRDHVLSKTPEGREVIDLYYKWSPVIMRAMEEDPACAEWIKSLVQGLTEYTIELSQDTTPSFTHITR